MITNRLYDNEAPYHYLPYPITRSIQIMKSPYRYASYHDNGTQWNLQHSLCYPSFDWPPWITRPSDLCCARVKDAFKDKKPSHNIHSLTSATLLYAEAKGHFQM